MHGRLRGWAIVAGVTSVLWGSVPTRAQEEMPALTFNSPVAFDVYAYTGGENSHLIGSTPSEQPLMIPPCQSWWVRSLPPRDMNEVRREIEEQGIPGLSLEEATDADLKRLQGLTGLHELDLSGTDVTDAGLAHLEGLTGLQELILEHTQVTDADLAHVSGLTGLCSLNIRETRVTDAGVEQLKKARPEPDVRR